MRSVRLEVLYFPILIYFRICFGFRYSDFGFARLLARLVTFFPRIGGIMNLRLIIVVLTLCATSPAVYGQSFPNKPIELVVPSSPGGGVDLVFRLIAEELAKNLKTPVNVANQTAGAGAVAAEKVAAAHAARPGRNHDCSRSQGAGKLAARLSAACDLAWLCRGDHAGTRRRRDQNAQRAG